jgi:hypothetical protein
MSTFYSWNSSLSILETKIGTVHYQFWKRKLEVYQPTVSSLLGSILVEKACHLGFSTGYKLKVKLKIINKINIFLIISQN